MRTKHAVVALLASLSGCSSSSGIDQAVKANEVIGEAPVNSPPHEAPGGIHYDEIEGMSLATMAELSLCQLVRHPMFDGAGLYVVERMTGYTEEDLFNPGSVKGFTYVDLALVSAWHMAQKRPVARILGGPYPSGEVGGWRISLKVGEFVALLLMDQRPENRNYYGLHELGTFKQLANGGYSNGQLFTQRRVDAAELGALIGGLGGGSLDDPCPYDVAPDVGRPVTTPTDSEYDQTEPTFHQGLDAPPDAGVRK